MKLSDFMERLEKDIEAFGDIKVMAFKIVDENSTREWYRSDKETGKRITVARFLKEIKASKPAQLSAKGE